MFLSTTKGRDPEGPGPSCDLRVGLQVAQEATRVLAPLPVELPLFLLSLGLCLARFSLCLASSAASALLCSARPSAFLASSPIIAPAASFILPLAFSDILVLQSVAYSRIHNRRSLGINAKGRSPSEARTPARWCYSSSSPSCSSSSTSRSRTSTRCLSSR